MKTRIAYWFVSGVFAMSTTASIILYLTKTPSIVDAFHTLGYPHYLIGLLGTAKILGLLPLFVKVTPLTLREWAYAGFTIDAFSAVWSGIASGQGPDVWAPPLVFVGLIVASYLLRRRVYPNQLLAPQRTAALGAHA